MFQVGRHACNQEFFSGGVQAQLPEKKLLTSGFFLCLCFLVVPFSYVFLVTEGGPMVLFQRKLQFSEVPGDVILLAF